MTQQKTRDPCEQEFATVFDASPRHQDFELDDVTRGGDSANFEDKMVEYQQPVNAVWSDRRAPGGDSPMQVVITPEHESFESHEAAASMGASNIEDKLIDYTQQFNAIWCDRLSSHKVKPQDRESNSLEQLRQEIQVDKTQAGVR